VRRRRDEHLGWVSDLDDPQAACFYHRVIQQHADRGEIDLLTLRLRGELTAYVCAFADGKALPSWDNRLSPVWAEHSAGRIANTEALERVVRSDTYDTLDWMRGEEGYKLQGATGVTLMQDVTAGSPRAVVGLTLARDRARAVKRRSRPITAAWEATATTSHVLRSRRS